MSHDPTTGCVPSYDDGPNYPDTPLRIEAERAYREAFLDASNEAVCWGDQLDQFAIDDAWDERRRVKERAQVERDGIYVYRPGHEVEAARTRGRVHAFEFVAQAWERGEELRLSGKRIAEEAIGPWAANVARWAGKVIDPARVSLPPRPDDDWPEPEKKPVASRVEPISRRMCDVPRTGNLTPFYKTNKPSKPEPPAPSLPVRSVSELIDHFPHLREPVIHGVLRSGETMNVIASSKTGKSWLVTDLALSVATGRPWLDAFPTERGNVLVVDNELHPQTSAHRIPKVMETRGIRLAEIAERLFVANVRGRLKDIFSLGTCFAEMTPGQYRVVILDAVYRLMPKDMDENDNGTMAQIYNALDSYAARLGCSFVLVHHSTKGNQSGKSITDVGAGAGAQARATDTHLVLRPHEQPDVVVLDAAVRSWPPISPRCLRWTFPVWTLDDTLDPADLRPERPRRKTKPQPAPVEPVKPVWDAERFARAFVNDEPTVTLAIIERAKKVGVPEGQGKKLLKLAEADGLVCRWRFGANQPVQFATRPQPEDRS